MEIFHVTFVIRIWTFGTACEGKIRMFFLGGAGLLCSWCFVLFLFFLCCVSPISKRSNFLCKHYLSLCVILGIQQEKKKKRKEKHTCGHHLPPLTATN